MTTVCFLMIPNVFESAMSCRDIGGNGPPPRDTNQMPAHGGQSVQSVRRKLFGDVDHQQTSLDLERQLRQCEERDRSKYNFDFISGQPLNSPDSRYQWSQISSDINDSEDNKINKLSQQELQEFSTKINKTSGDSIAQSSNTQSQSATSSPTPTPTLTPPDILTDTPTPTPTPTLTPPDILTDTPTPTPTSATIAPDSQPQPSSSSVELKPNVGQKHQIVNTCNQTKITEYFDGRKSAESQRKRSAAQVVSHKDRATTKRHRLECASAVKLEDSETGVSTPDVTDIEDEESVRESNRGTPV